MTMTTYYVTIERCDADVPVNHLLAPETAPELVSIDYNRSRETWQFITHMPQAFEAALDQSPAVISYREVD